jgi:hypothetical protein
VQAHDALSVHRLPSAALQAVFPDEAHVPPEQSPPQQS